MKKQKLLKIATILIVMLFCMEIPLAFADDTSQTIPYAESKMAEFSKELSETKELYVEWSNGKIRTAIDIPSGNAYEESEEDGKRIYFQTQPNQQFPVGVYELLERNQVPCFLSTDCDAIIDMYSILMSIGDSSVGTVQVSYDGANRKETVKSGEETRTMTFWGDTAIPMRIGIKNDMQDFQITFNIFSRQIPDEKIKTALQNGLKGYSLYIPPNPYA